jgi:predicted DNA-binding protein (UPF0251 family)
MDATIVNLRGALRALLAGRLRSRPSETIGESDAPVGEEKAEGEIREANMRLPEHQREALALRELEELSYDEIATAMETNRNAVAQLISRARINLHDELRGNLLASVAAPSPECERALPLIASREDGQLDSASRDATWLDAHLADCHRCRLGVEVMREAAASYRAWAPIAATPGMLEDTMAKAAELVGVAPGELERSGAAKSGASAGPGRGRPQRRRATVVTGLAALLLLTGVAAAVVARDDPPATPVDAATGTGGPSGAASQPGAKPAKASEGKRGAAKKARTGPGAVAGDKAPAATIAGETASEPASTPAQTTTGGGAPSEPASRPNRSSGKTAVQPTQPTSTSKPSTKSKPAPAPAPAPQPAPTPEPVAEEPPPAEESPGKSSGHAAPPGKPADRPPK